MPFRARPGDFVFHAETLLLTFLPRFRSGRGGTQPRLGYHPMQTSRANIRITYEKVQNFFGGSGIFILYFLKSLCYI